MLCCGRRKVNERKTHKKANTNQFSNFRLNLRTGTIECFMYSNVQLIMSTMHLYIIVFHAPPHKKPPCSHTFERKSPASILPTRGTVEVTFGRKAKEKIMNKTSEFKIFCSFSLKLRQQKTIEKTNS